MREVRKAFLSLAASYGRLQPRAKETQMGASCHHRAFLLIILVPPAQTDAAPLPLCGGPRVAPAPSRRISCSAVMASCVPVRWPWVPSLQGSWQLIRAPHAWAAWMSLPRGHPVRAGGGGAAPSQLPGRGHHDLPPYKGAREMATRLVAPGRLAQPLLTPLRQAHISYPLPRAARRERVRLGRRR